MEPIDDMLRRAGRTDIPPALSRMDGAVMAGLRRRHEGRVQGRLLGAIALAALLAGGAGAWLPDHENAAVMGVAPSLDLAPSTLLAPFA